MLLLVGAGLVLVLFLAAGITTAVLLINGIAQSRYGVRAAPIGDAEAQVVERGGDARPISDAATLEAGDSVTTRSGTTQIDAGQAATLRAAPSTSVTLDRKGASGRTAQLSVDAGRVYVVAAPNAAVEIDGNGVRATVASGRLVVACEDAVCAFQALEEPQRLVTPGGESITLKPHQRYAFDASATEAPPEDEPSTPSGDGTTESALQLAATTVTYTAPDALRSDPFLEQNAELDAQQDRAYPAISGRSVVGTYTMTLRSTLVSAPIRRQVVIDLDCTGVEGCEAIAVTGQAACPDGASVCEIRGTVGASDAQGDSLRLTYAGFDVDCASQGGVDGTGTFTDSLTFSGSEDAPEITGTRAAVYTPGSGSSCADERADFLNQSIDLTAEKGEGGDAFPDLAEEQLLGRHVNAGYTCERAEAPLAGSEAHLVCEPGNARDVDGLTRPDRLELVSFSSTGALEDAYDALADPTGLRREGTCGVSNCEEPWDGEAGRLLLHGSGDDAELASYLPERTTMLVLAKGGTLNSLFDWHQKSTDISYGSLHLFGI